MQQPQTPGRRMQINRTGHHPQQDELALPGPPHPNGAKGRTAPGKHSALELIIQTQRAQDEAGAGGHFHSIGARKGLHHLSPKTPPHGHQQQNQHQHFQEVGWQGQRVRACTHAHTGVKVSFLGDLNPTVNENCYSFSLSKALEH